jgi:hypothetical protein
MRKPALLALLWLVLCGIGWGAAPPASGEKLADKLLVDRLLETARNNASLRVRVTALYVLTHLEPKGAEAGKARKSGLQAFLRKTPLSDEDRVFLPYVIIALGNLGPAARDVLPELAELKGTDRTLDNAIDKAVTAILKKKAAAGRTLKEMQKDLNNALDPRKPPTEDHINVLVGILQDATNAPSLRVMAAKALGVAAKGDDKIKKLALDALKKVAGAPMVEKDLESVANAAIKAITGGKP